MAGWNGSGTFNRLYSWLADAAAGIDITASRMDDDTNAITAQGFANCLTRDGQGSATALLPMNGYRHTGAAAGVALTDYATVSQLVPPGTSGVPAIIPAGAYLGEIRMTAVVESFLATLMPGWHVCSGGTRPRTDPLFVAVGTSWSFGTGDGSTTYTLPDMRGRVAAGKDDMGGTPANRITAGVSGIAGTMLGASGGDQHAQADTISTTLSGSVTAASTGTSTVTDPTHDHPLPAVTSGTGSAGVGGGTASAPVLSGPAATGVTVATSVTTAITNTMGVSSSSGLLGASQNVQPSLILNLVIFVGAP
jgi:microcystin-dependent protein